MKIHGKGKNGRPDMVYPQDFCAEPRRMLSKGERKAWQSLMGRLQSSVVLLGGSRSSLIRRSSFRFRMLSIMP